MKKTTGLLFGFVLSVSLPVLADDSMQIQRPARPQVEQESVRIPSTVPSRDHRQGAGEQTREALEAQPIADQWAEGSPTRPAGDLKAAPGAPLIGED